MWSDRKLSLDDIQLSINYIEVKFQPRYARDDGCIGYICAPYDERRVLYDMNLTRAVCQFRNNYLNG